jgi:hypothetical protein
MDNNSVIFMAVAILLFVVLMVVSFKTGGTKKLKVTLADDSTIEVTRKWNDGWNDIKDMKCYHQGDKKIWLANHWIIRIEEL